MNIRKKLNIALIVTLVAMLVAPLVGSPFTDNSQAVVAQEPVELVHSRGENSKSYYSPGGGAGTTVIGGGIQHWKYDYDDPTELWKDVDLSWEDVGEGEWRIDQAPYTVSYNGEELTFTDRKTRETTILQRISVSPDVPFVIVPRYYGVSFQHVITPDQLPFEARFRVTVGDAEILPRAYDDEGPLMLDVIFEGGVLIERMTEVRCAETGELRPAVGVIRIDPTLLASTSVKDTYLSETNKTTNYGSVEKVVAGVAAGTDRRALLSFNLTDDIPGGVTIDYAELWLYYFEGYYQYHNVDIVAHRLDRTDWVESEATWNIYKTGSNWATAGGDYVVVGETVKLREFGWTGWNVTAMVEHAYTESESVEIILVPAAGAPDNRYAQFHSREYVSDSDIGYAPMLAIGWNSGFTYQENQEWDEQTGVSLSLVSVNYTGGGVAQVDYTLSSSGYVYFYYGIVLNRRVVSSSETVGTFDYLSANNPEPGIVYRWDYVVDLGWKTAGTYNFTLNNLPSTEKMYWGIYASNSAAARRAGGTSTDYFAVTGDYVEGRTLAVADIDVTETTATLSMSLLDLNAAFVTVSFEYGTTSGYGQATTPEYISPEVPYTYTDQITGLSPGTTYHFRGKAVNENGTVYFGDRIFTTRDEDREGTLVVDGARVTFPNQHNSVYAQGRHWLFYYAGGGQVEYVSSVDGVEWDSPVEVVASVDEYSFAVAFNNTHVHFVYADRGDPIYYKRGTLATNGTISWGSQQEVMPSAGASALWTTPTIEIDAGGYPWVVVGLCGGDDSLKLTVTSSNTTDDTWTNREGFPEAMGSLVPYGYQRGSLVPLENGDMYLFSVARGLLSSPEWQFRKWHTTTHLLGRLWSSEAGSWGDIEYVSMNPVQYLQDAIAEPRILWSCVADGNDIVVAFNSMARSTEVARPMVANPTRHDLRVAFRDYDNGWDWAGEKLLQSYVGEWVAPIVSRDPSTELIYVFWGGSPDANTIYYNYMSDGVWLDNSVEWLFENMLQGSDKSGAGLFTIQAWRELVEGVIGVYYNVYTNLSVGGELGDATSPGDYVARGGSSSHAIKIAYLGSAVAVSTLTATDISSTSMTLRGQLADDGGVACDVRFEWGYTAGMGSYTAWQTNKTTGFSFSYPLSDLGEGVTVYYRAQARDATLVIYSGSTRTATTGSGSLAVTTVAASSIALTSARLNSVLDWDGGHPCTIRFGWGNVTSPTMAGYDNLQTLTGTYTSGSHPYLDVSGLNISMLYYFRVDATNVDGTTTGAELTFTTASTLGDVQNFNGIPSDDSISLWWDVLPGASNYLIRYKAGEFPTGVTDGTLVYFDTSASTVHEDLTPGTTYYYMLWGESGGTYSSNATLMLTTTAGAGAGMTPDYTSPTEIPRWLGGTDYTNVAGLGFIYTITNNVADSLDVPRGNWWFATWMILSVIAGIVVYVVSKGKLMIATMIMTTLLVVGWLMMLVPFWIPLIGGIIIIGSFVAHREVARGSG